MGRAGSLVCSRAASRTRCVCPPTRTPATMQNSAVMAALTAILAAGMGVAAPSLQSGATGAAGVLGISIPSISAPAKMSPLLGVPAAPDSPDGNAVQQCHAWRLRAAGGGAGSGGRITLRLARPPALYSCSLGCCGGDWSGASAGTPTLNRVPGGRADSNPLAMCSAGRAGGAAGGSGPSGLRNRQ